MSNVKCQNCKQEFAIYSDDRKMYQKFEVPDPTLCPDCRMQRRLSWRNNLAFYQCKCDLCHKSLITQYPPSVSFPIYCPDCWWSDKWDRYATGRDYDFDQPFFPQFIAIMNNTPRLSTFRLNCVNCDYVDKTAGSKNCYLIIGSLDAEDCYYGEKFLKTRDCIDGNFILQCELSYYCLDSKVLYNCNFCQDCASCSDCNFCYDCRNCQDCLMCWNLRNKRFCILNKEYSEAEYRQKLEQYNLGSFANYQKTKKLFNQEKRQKSINCFIRANKAVKSSGNYLFGTDNCWFCFNVMEFKDCRYANDDEQAKEMMDTNNCGYGELNYEIQDAYANHSCKFCNVLTENSFCDYCVQTTSCKDCFGCSGLNKAQFCILNKQYSEAEYQKLKEQIIAKMKEGGEYGEFFPTKFSPFGYNETKANLFFPMTKEEVLAKGWNWAEEKDELSEQVASNYEIPDDIKEVKDEILDKILSCQECGKNYKLIKQELDFYRKKDLAIPRKCFRCRYFEIFSLRNPRKLWTRKCDKCNKELETTYAPDRPETIYCEECYRKEIY